MKISRLPAKVSAARLLLVGLLLGAVPSWAATELVEYGTAVTFTDSGGDVTWDVTGLATAAGRISARHDLTTSHTPFYQLECTFQGVTTVTVGNAFEVYLAYSTGGNPDGEIGTADAALTTDKRNNLKHIMNVITDQTATDTNMTASRKVEIPSRYVSVGVWNASGVTTEAGAGTSKCVLVPLLRKIQ